MTQHYTQPLALLRMSEGNCPECGEPPESHAGPGADPILVMFAPCNLYAHGVTDRIDQYHQDQKEQA